MPLDNIKDGTPYGRVLASLRTSREGFGKDFKREFAGNFVKSDTTEILEEVWALKKEVSELKSILSQINFKLGGHALVNGKWVKLDG